MRRIGLRRTARAQREPKLKGATIDDNERERRAKCKNVALPGQLRAIFATSCRSDSRYHLVRRSVTMTATWIKPEFVIVAVTLEVTAYAATR